MRESGWDAPEGMYEVMTDKATCQHLMVLRHGALPSGVLDKWTCKDCGAEFFHLESFRTPRGMIQMHGIPLNIETIHRIVTALVTEGAVHVEGCQQSGLPHALYLLDLMQRRGENDASLRDQFAMAVMSALLQDPR